MWIITFFQIAFLLTSPFWHCLLGQKLICWLTKLTPEYWTSAAITRPFQYVLGLLFHLTMIFFMKDLGLGWATATFLPLAIIVLPPLETDDLFSGFKPPAHLNFVLWFGVVLALGLTLFSVNDGIQTPWRNNYGDLTFHIGTITSFVLGNNFPPEYHIFPGVRFSYPFFVNLWSASLWWINPKFSVLALVFCFQWVVLWSLVYKFLDGDRYWTLPWCLLFGGGAYGILGQNSGELINQGAAWSDFLTTIWVTQRGALFGIVGALAALRAFHYGYLNDKLEQKVRHTHLLLSGIILSLLPLIHAHICLVVTLYLLIVLGIQGLVQLYELRGRFLLHGALLDLGLFVVSLLPSLIFLPWLVGKKGMIKFMMGWTVGINKGVINSAWMWISSAPVFLAAFFLVWAVSRKHKLLTSFCLLFVAGNFVQLAEWDWDQIKVFLALYAILLSVWSVSGSRWLMWSQLVLCPLLIYPSLYDCYRSFAKGELHTVYSKENMSIASVISTVTPRNAIFAAKPDHNSLITLTGRKLFQGYNGTLYSHGINYQQRELINRDLTGIRNCKKTPPFDQTPALCPGYLLWTDGEKRFWAKQDPGEGFERTPYPFLYRIN